MTELLENDEGGGGSAWVLTLVLQAGRQVVVSVLRRFSSTS